MKRLLAALTAAAILLALNYFEPDTYENFTPPPSGANVDKDDGLLWRVLPEAFVHPAPDGKQCRHPMELVESRRVMSLTDHDGWYRLFWAGDDEYHFDDPVFLVAAMNKRTSGAAQGRWTIRARAAAKPCGLKTEEISLDYVLEVGPEPAAAESLEIAGLNIPRVVTWLVQRVDTANGPRLVTVAWRLK